jgi:hypothetical protein
VEKRYAKRFLPIATSLMGRVIGLCSLKDEDTLKVQVVEPLIAATDQFGRKSPESKGGLFGPV